MPSNERDNLCIYIDLENILKTKNVNISKVMKDIVIKYNTKKENDEPIFVYKIACGNSESINKYREQLKSLNFEIRETPHIVNKKNRSDLIISLDAFEKLYLDKPTIDEYIFITNDSDFSVIMDILRRYGKKVVLVTTKEDSERDIFNNCSDKILIIDEYTDNELKQTKTKNIAEETDENKSNDDIAISNLMNVLKALDPDEEYPIAQLASKFRVNDKSFDIGKTKFKKFGKLAEYFQAQGIIKIDINKDNKDKIITLVNIN